ncbi:MAG: YveK family protein [Acutalibacteraceae bacterium]
MTKDQNVKTVKIKDMWQVLVSHILVIVAAAVACAVVVFIVCKVAVKPKYESTATLYILNQDNEKNSSSASTDFSLALNVVNDCTYLLKSHAVLDEVIDDLNLDISFDELADCIATKNPDQTRVLEVTVKADSPQEAKRIVDAVCSVGTEKIMDAMGFKQVNLYEKGTLPTEPCNNIALKAAFLAAVAAAVIAYGVFLVIFIFDDKLRTEDDIEKYLNISIIGRIPNVEDVKNNKGKYYRRSEYSRSERYIDSSEAARIMTERTADKK